MFLRKVLLIIFYILLSLSHVSVANEELLELQRLYKEMFGIDLVEEKVTEEFQIIVNGTVVASKEISYMNLTLSYEIPKDDVLSMIETNLKKGAKIILSEKFPDMVTADILKENGFTVKLDATNKQFILTLAAEYSKKYIINLRRDRSTKKLDLSGYALPSTLSNYTNFSYSENIFHDNADASTKQLTYSGALGLPLVSVLYTGKIGLVNRLEDIAAIRRLKKLKADIHFGSGPIIIGSEIKNFDKFDTHYFGLKYLDKRPNQFRKQKNPQVEVLLKEESKVSIIVNKSQVYSKKHFPGEYVFQGFSIRNGKNKVVIVVDNPNTPFKKEKVIYNLAGYAPGKSNIDFEFGYFTNDDNTANQTSSISLSDKSIFKSMINLGVRNNMVLKNESVLMDNKLFQTYTIERAGALGTTETSVSADLANDKNKQRYILKHGIQWNKPWFFKKTKRISMNSQYIYMPSLYVNDKKGKKSKVFRHTLKLPWLAIKYQVKDDVQSTSIGLKYKYRQFSISNNLLYNSHSNTLNLGNAISGTMANNLVLSLSSQVSNNGSYSFQLRGSYLLKILNQDFKPQIAGNYNKTTQGELANAAAKPSFDYKLLHSFTYKNDEKEFEIKDSFAEDNINLGVSYKDSERTMSYSILKPLERPISQKFKYGNNMLNLSMSETNKQSTIVIQTAVAFTPTQIGVSKRINNGFTLFKPAEDLPSGSKIYADSASFSVFSAVGKGSAAYKTEKIKYKSSRVQNERRLSSESFLIQGVPHRGYAFTALNYRQFNLKAQLIDKHTREPIDFGELVTIYKREEGSFPNMEMIGENGEFKIYDLKPGKYLVSVYGYKPFKLDARNVGYSETLDLGSIYLKQLTKLRTLYD